jgi:RND family efflux transporter MFP subunit
MSRFSGVLGAVALCMATCLAGACSSGEAARDSESWDDSDRVIPVVVSRPVVRSLDDVFLEREATIFPVASPRIATRQDGFVVRYATELGDILHEGDLIAELDPTDHRLKLAELRAALERTRATLAERETAWKRTHELFERNVISEGQRDDRRAALDRARADVGEAQARVARAEQDLRELRIYAPIPGVVTEQLSWAGEYLERGDALAAMKRIDVVLAVCTVRERDLADVQEGAPALVAVTRFPGRRFEGLIWKIVPDVDVRSRSTPIKVLLPNPELTLTPGMSARVLFVRSLERALLIPKDAVLAEGDERYVLLVSDGVARRQPVRLGAAIGDKWHVRTGLEGSESVIVAGNEDLEAGSAVQVVDLPPPGPPTLPTSLQAEPSSNGGS